MPTLKTAWAGPAGPVAMHGQACMRRLVGDPTATDLCAGDDDRTAARPRFNDRGGSGLTAGLGGDERKKMEWGGSCARGEAVACPGRGVRPLDDHAEGDGDAGEEDGALTVGLGDGGERPEGRDDAAAW
jgi:hypothetical protein